MNVVDSSAWLEYFANGSGAGFFAAAIEDTEVLVVPAVAVCEVFRRVLEQRDEGDALRAIAVMQQGLVVELDARLALAAARVGVETRLPLAASVILATARLHQATLWTQDPDLGRLPGVRYRARRG